MPRQGCGGLDDAAQGRGQLQPAGNTDHRVQQAVQPARLAEIWASRLVTSASSSSSRKPLSRLLSR